jgi:hypothetical protein
MTEWLVLVGEVSANFCRMVSARDPHCHILDFLDWSRYYFFHVAPQLYPWGWVYPVPDPLRLRNSSSAGNRNWNLRICSQELWTLDHRGGMRLNSFYSRYRFVMHCLYCVCESEWIKVCLCPCVCLHVVWHSLLHNVQTDPGTYPVGTGTLFPGIK